MTTTANRRMRIAALGLSTALSVGVLAPFIGTGSADAAVSCTTAKANYTKAANKVKADQKKLKKAKKKLRKAVHARKSVKVIKHDKKVVKHKKHALKVDKARRNAAYNALKTCSNGSTSTPAGTANPLTSLLQTLTGAGLSPAALTDALNSIASQLQSSGAPGAAQLADALKQVSAAITSGASSIDPSQLQKILAELPSSLDPAAFQKALTDAATALQSSLANPPTTANGLIDAILNPLVKGMSEFPAADPLTSALSSIQGTLDGILTGLGLPGLGGLSSLPGSGGLPIPIPGL
jgi:hypothetical protein